MPLDIAVLAATVVTSYLIPYAKEGAQQIADKVIQKYGKVAAEHVTNVAKQIWDRVEAVFTGDSDKKVLDLFKDDPEELQGKMKKTVQEKLETDDQLKKELEELVSKPSPDGFGTGAQIMHNSGIVGFVDARYAEIKGGVVAGNVFGAPPPATEAKDS